jgi:5,10-methylenetetrahydrofolate reductase
MQIEITVRDLQVLPKIIENLKAINPVHINLTDKTGILDNLESATILKSEFPQVKLTVHYALKNHTSKTALLIVEKFEEYLTRASELEIDEILIISGSQKPKFDTLAALEYINENIEIFKTKSSDSLNKDKTKAKKALHKPIIAVAYNPFLTDEKLIEENKRLVEKLKYDFVKKVYFQIGSVYRPIIEAKDLIESINPNIQVVPSLPVPSESFLRKFKMKPWKGVYLDEKYLSNLKNSQTKTIELLDIMDQNELSPVLELFEISRYDFENLKAVINFNS